MKKIWFAFMALCAIPFVALAATPLQYRTLVGPEGWTMTDITEGPVLTNVFGDGALTSGMPFSAVLRVSLAGTIRYGALVSFGKLGTRQVTLTVASVVTSDGSSEGRAYLSSDDAATGVDSLVAEFRLPGDTFRAFLTYDIALTFDGTEFKVYVNGEPMTLTNTKGAVAQAVFHCEDVVDLSDVSVGVRINRVGTTTGGHDLTGSMWRDAVVFNEALSAEQVAMVHEAGVWALLAQEGLIAEPDKEGDVYVLDSPEDFQWFITQCPNDAAVRLDADIALTAHDQAIKPTFSGIFDGNGYTLTLQADATVQGENTTPLGLIAGILEGATVKNLSVRMEGGLLARDGAVGILAGTATNTTFENVVVACTGSLEGGNVGGLVGVASELTLKGVRVDFSGMALGENVGGLAGSSTGTFAVEGSLLTFIEGETVDALMEGGTVAGAVIGVVDGTAALAGLTLVDTSLQGATVAIGQGTPQSEPTLLLAEGSSLLKEGEEATFTSGQATIHTPAVTQVILDAKTGTAAPVASAGWEVSDWNAEAKTFTLTPTGTDLAATGTLTYSISVMEPASDATWQGSVIVSCPLSNQTADGWWELDSETDYAWFLASCPSGAKVRLTADIELEAKTYSAYNPIRHESKLEFDGQGHTVTLPKGATMVGYGGNSEYCGVIAGQLKNGFIEDVNVVVGGTLTGNNGAYIGGALGSSSTKTGGAVRLSNVHVRLLGTAVITGNLWCAGGLVGRAFNDPVTVEDCSIVAEAGATIGAATKGVALTCGKRDTGTSKNVLAVDLGIIMPGGASYTTHSGEIAYRGCNTTVDYGKEVATLLAGDVTCEAGKAVTLAPEALTIDEGEVSAPEGWTVVRSEAPNAFTLARTGEDDGEPCSFTYTLKHGDSGAIVIPVHVHVVSPPTQTADGWWELDSEADYAWYLAFCPRDAKVRLTADIGLLPRHYGMAPRFGTLTFDGDGHSITFPEGATLKGEYCGLVAGSFQQGAIKNVKAIVGGTFVGENGAYVGGIVGSSAYDEFDDPVELSNAHVRLLKTARFMGYTYNAGGLVGACYRTRLNAKDCTIIAEAGATFAPEPLTYSVALTCNIAKNTAGECTQENVIALDLGIVMPSGSVYAREDGATIYKGHGVTTDYGEATTLLAGDAILDYGKPVTLAPEGVNIREVIPPANWEVERTEGSNVVTFTSDTFVSDDDGTPGDFSYTIVHGNCVVDVPVAAVFADHPVLDKNGWYNLDSEEDYAWYLAKCPNGAKVRLTSDIMLLPKDYGQAWMPVKHASSLTFDGQGYTVTLPEGATLNGEYCGVVAGQVKNGSIQNVKVVVGGTLKGEKGAYVGGILGSSTYQTGGSVTLANAHVRLLETAVFTGNTWRAGGLVGLAYKDPVTVERCSAVAEAGATIGSARDGAALTCGGRETGASSEVYALDLGIIMPSGKSSYTTHAGETVYTATTQTVTYPAGKGTLVSGVVAGSLEDGESWTLAPTGLTVQNVQAPEGWTAMLEGNTLILTGPAGATGTVTYGLDRFPLAQMFLSVTLPGYTFTLPDGAQPSETLTIALEAAAKAAGLAPGSEQVTVKLVGKATLEALEVFTGICTADVETRTLSVAYDFGITDVRVSDDRTTVIVTVSLRTNVGDPAFAPNTKIVLKTSDGEEAPLGDEVVPAQGQTSVELTFPLTADTCVFRAQAIR